MWHLDWNHESSTQNAISIITFIITFLDLKSKNVMHDLMFDILLEARACVTSTQGHFGKEAKRNELAFLFSQMIIISKN